jgi:hypothetical protein
VKLVAHLIRKDLRAVVIVALIWIVLMAIELALQLSGAAARPYDLRRPSLLHMLKSFLPFAEVAIAALIVSLVIHEDPLVDTRAFWLTRPISRSQLFLAKLGAIAIIIFAPALAAFGVLLAWYHVPPVYMMRAGFEVVLWLAVPLLILTATATLTSTLSRYLMLLVGMIVGALAVIGLAEMYEAVAQVRVFGPRLPRFVDPARAVTVTAILIAGFLASIHLFYRRRDWRAALGGIVLVVGAATLASRYWPGFELFAPLGEATGAWTNPAVSHLRVLDARRMVISYNARELRSVSAPIVLDGLPKGYTATPFTLEGRLTRTDGSVLTSGPAAPMQIEARSDYQPSLTMAYGNDPVDAGSTSWEAWPVLLELGENHRSTLAKGHAAEGDPFGVPPTPPKSGPAFYTGKYNGTFSYRIAHHEQVAALQLDRRGSYTDGPRGIAIVDARDVATGCEVTLEVTSTELTLAGPREPGAGYYFVDRQTGERLRAGRGITRSGMLGPLRVGLSPGRRIFTAAYVKWNVMNARVRDKDEVSSCADMNLIVVRRTAAGSLTRSIEIPDFQVQASQDMFFRR